MAKFIQAVSVYGPRLDLNPTVQLDELAAWMSSRTGLNKSEIRMVLQELHDGIAFFTRQGTPVKLEGVGTFKPGINTEGVLNLHFRVDNRLREVLNAPRSYQGRIKNAANIGLSNEAFKALWDADNPDDPVELNGST